MDLLILKIFHIKFQKLVYIILKYEIKYKIIFAFIICKDFILVFIFLFLHRNIPYQVLVL